MNGCSVTASSAANWQRFAGIEAAALFANAERHGGMGLAVDAFTGDLICRHIDLNDRCLRVRSISRSGRQQEVELTRSPSGP